MIIPPPRDDVQIDEIAEFTKEQYEYLKERMITHKPDIIGPVSRGQMEYIKSRLNKPTWMCPKCGLNNHHYNQQCARCKCEKLLEIQEHGGKEL